MSLLNSKIDNLKAKSICSNSFFSEELPPCFSSIQLGEWVSRLTRQEIAALINGKKKNGAVELIDTYGASYGGLLRKHSTPSPHAFVRLALELQRSKKEIVNHLEQSQFSASKPTTSHKYRALGLTYQFKDLLNLRRRFSKGNPFFLQTDISNCYPSIYTHSIAWALHGKVDSKLKTRDWSMLGNRLDSYIMDGQGGETRGIPIGPDTSRTVSEIVLSDVDRHLQAKGAQGFRFMDDYSIFCKSREDAEDLLGTLQIELMKYRLNVNPSKTLIREHKNSFEEEWVGYLRNKMPRSLRSANAFEKFEALISTCLEKYLRTPAIKYLFTTIKNESRDQTIDERLMQLLFLCVENELALIPELIKFLARVAESGGYDENAFLNFERWIPTCVRMGYHIEIAWILWFASERGVTLSAPTLEICSSIESNYIALLIMILIEKGLCHEVNLPILGEVESLHEDSNYRANWLFRYECARKGWLDPAPLKHLCLNTFFDDGVTFLREDIGKKKWYVSVANSYA